MSDLLKPESTALVLVDFQERFNGPVARFEEAVARAAVLAGGAAALGMRIVVTEQYPKGLGRTVDAIRDVIGDEPPVEKTVFSAARADGFDLGSSKGAIVCGVEAHVCVAQTVLDLLAAGIRVQVPADAVASRADGDRDTALQRLRARGADVTTVEAALFELVGGAGHERFREVQALIK